MQFEDDACDLSYGRRRERGVHILLSNFTSALISCLVEPLLDRDMHHQHH
jgi:hypothetical protein